MPPHVSTYEVIFEWNLVGISILQTCISYQIRVHVWNYAFLYPFFPGIKICRWTD